MSIVLNLISFISGIIACMIPITGMVLKIKRPAARCFWSFTFGGAATLFQILEIRHRVHMEDWTALADTMDAIVTLSETLLVILFILNLFAIAWAKWLEDRE